jgi:hypothetical protein
MWNIVVDMSGMPPDDIYIGLVLFNDKYKPKFLYEFYQEFPDLRAYAKKSTRVDNDKLLKILRFFNSKKLRMVCYQFGNHQWKKHERMLNELLKERNPNHKYKNSFYRFYERLIGILYYYAITQIGVKQDNYEVIACHESSIDIWEVFKTIQILAKRDGWHIRPNANIRKVEHLLKMADYVAGANRKLEDYQLEDVGRHIILKDPIKEADLRKIFGIWGSKDLNLSNFINKNQQQDQASQK